jgi:phenylacetic acid degradation operon negative regulatory protein
MPSQQPRWLILDFFAAFVRRFDDKMAIAHLIQLMAELELDEQTVRSSVSRLKRKGWLEPERVDGQVGYRVSASALRDLSEGDPRVYHLEPSVLSDGWCLITFSIPESLRTKRHELRSKLTWWGFGNLAPGVWVAPQRSATYATRVVEQLELRPYTAVFEGHYVGLETLKDFVHKAWDFPRLSTRYERFLAENDHLTAKWIPGRDSPGDAFVDYLRMLNSWRSIPFLDPGLPKDLMTPDWRGTEATQLFHDLSDRLLAPAIRHVETVTGRKVQDAALAS